MLVSMSFRLLLYTPIPVRESQGGFQTLDLWVRDLYGQKEVVNKLTLLTSLSEPGTQPVAQLPDGIQVVNRDTLSRKQLEALLREHDVVQVFAEQRWFRSRAMRIVRAARKANRCVVLGISSNRAATTILNARHKRIHRRIKARFDAACLMRNVHRLGRWVDGVFLTGHGLVGMVKRTQSEVHIGTASWISLGDMVGEDSVHKKILASHKALSVCVAARLEPMKGVHLAIEALQGLTQQKVEEDIPVNIEIFGEGPQLDNLHQQVSQAGLEKLVQFGGTFPYPEPFWKAISVHDLLLITNMNVEQPRIIFDAISQGLVPICPDSLPYKELGMDSRVLYRQGDATSLAETIRAFMSPKARAEVMPALRKLAREHTLGSMHELRAQWIKRLLVRRQSISAK